MEKGSNSVRRSSAMSSATQEGKSLVHASDSGLRMGEIQREKSRKDPVTEAENGKGFAED